MPGTCLFEHLSAKLVIELRPFCLLPGLGIQTVMAMHVGSQADSWAAEGGYLGPPLQAQGNWVVQGLSSSPTTTGGGSVQPRSQPGSSGSTSSCLFAPIKAPTSSSQILDDRWGGVLLQDVSQSVLVCVVPGKCSASCCGCSQDRETPCVEAERIEARQGRAVGSRE